jgi:hypothetical protein
MKRCAKKTNGQPRRHLVAFERYLARKGSAGSYWMVWDRAKRGPALIDNRPLVQLSREAANAAVRSLSGENQDDDQISQSATKWQVTYGGHVTVDCRDEHDAKMLAQRLVEKGYRISARTRAGLLPARIIEPYEIRAWVSRHVGTTDR